MKVDVDNASVENLILRELVDLVAKFKINTILIEISPDVFSDSAKASSYVSIFRKISHLLHCTSCVC